MIALLALAGCFGKPDGEDTAPASCGDVDGTGGETGDVPDVIGLWTSTFGYEQFAENCDGTLAVDSFPWLGGAVEIEGWAPTGLRLTFDGDADDLGGVIAPTGGLIFSGQQDSESGTVHAAIGGLVYHDAFLDRSVWAGMAWLGVDVDANGSIDCEVRGDYRAIQSGR
jgi:hypothetical protein